MLARLPRVASPAPRVLAGYVLRRGDNPAPVRVRTPHGRAQLRLRHVHDYTTVAEIYAQEIYPVGPTDDVIVDVGANIGSFSVYAATRRPSVRVYAYEPVAENLERLRANVAPFGDRVTVNPVAMAVAAGEVQFGIEETGRYGGIGVETAAHITVPAVAIADVVTEIIEREGRIDVLKLDVEGLERDLLAAVPEAAAAKIGRVVLEWRYDDLRGLEPWKQLGFTVSGGPFTWVLER